jgi:hypothetical protein
VGANQMILSMLTIIAILNQAVQSTISSAPRATVWHSESVSNEG